MTANVSSESTSDVTFSVGDFERLGSRNYDLFRVLLAARVSQVDKEWGREFVVATNDFLLKVIEVFDGHRTSLQHHEEKTEIHWLLHGTGGLYLEVGDEADQLRFEREAGLRPSIGLLVEPHQVHRATGPLLILEISTNHPDDVVRHSDDYGREDRVAGGDS